MPHFGLFIYGDPSRWTKFSPEEMQKVMERYIAWGQKAANGGFLLGSHRLAEEVGKVMRGTRVTDGPYSETKEILGGYYVIRAASYDEAVQRCSDHPHLEYGGVIEVRQLHAMEKQD